MNNFRSHQFPISKNPILMVQEHAMYYYAVCMIILLLGLVLKMFAGNGSIMWFGVLGVLASMTIGNVAAIVSLRKAYAEIFFVGEHFSLISVYDILFPKQPLAFPLRFANARRSEDQIAFHFNDQIIVIKKEDWDDFELIWAAFLNNERMNGVALIGDNNEGINNEEVNIEIVDSEEVKKEWLNIEGDNISTTLHFNPPKNEASNEEVEDEKL